MFRINTLSSCLFNCVSTVVFATLGLMCWDVWSDSREIPLEEPALHDYLPHVEELREQGRLGEAIAVGNFLETQEDMPHRDEIIQIRDEIIVEQSSWFSRSGRFLTGFVTGNATSMEGMAGTVISDFLVIGEYVGADWAKSKSALTIQKAVFFRDAGFDVKIVTEAAWIDALSE